MTVVAYILGVLLFVVGLLGSVALHEAGHLIPGKLFNVKVTQYFVGFGRTIWSKFRGETEYGLKAIPLGGYCKLVGMVEPKPDADPDQVRSRATGMFAQLIDDARDAEYEHVSPEDHDRLFYKKPWWQQVIIMGSGVAINLVLAFILFAILLMGYGTYQPTTTVDAVSQCVVAVTEETANEPHTCGRDDPDAPAKIAGFRAGDTIVAVNGTRIVDWQQLQRLIAGNGNNEARFDVERDGQEISLTAKTVVTTNNVDPTNPSKVTEVGFLGIVPATVRERQGIGAVGTTMWDGTVQTLKTIGAMPNKVYHVGLAIVGAEERDPAGPMSVVGVGRIAGDVAAERSVPVWDRFFTVVGLLASLNMFLGLVNLVPLPPFDGGGIATTLISAIRRKWAKLRGKPDPGSIDSAQLLPLTYVMAVLLLVMTVVLVIGDIVAPVTLT